MSYCDVHAHLADERFDADREAVIKRAREVGVSDILCVGETLEEAQRILELCRGFDGMHACAGLYPQFADLEECDRILAFIKLHRHEITCIGEVGLDYWLAQEEEQRELQREVLRRFVALSNELELPLNVHSRSAGKYTLQLLIESNASKVLMHAFDGKASAALAGVEAGYYFSIPPSVVRSPQKRKLVKALPLEVLMLETDSPVLGPDKAQRNEPANIVYSAQAVAEIKGVDRETVAEVTWANAKNLFAI